MPRHLRHKKSIEYKQEKKRLKELVEKYKKEDAAAFLEAVTGFYKFSTMVE